MHSVMQANSGFTETEVADPALDSDSDASSEEGEIILAKERAIEAKIKLYFDTVTNQVTKFQEESDKRNRMALDSVNEYVHMELAKIKQTLADVRADVARSRTQANYEQFETTVKSLADDHTDQIKQIKEEVKTVKDASTSSQQQTTQSIKQLEDLHKETLKNLSEKIDETKAANDSSVKHLEALHTDAVKDLTEKIDETKVAATVGANELTNPRESSDLQQLQQDVSDLRKNSDDRLDNMKQRVKYLKTRVDGGYEESALRESLKLSTKAYIKYKKKYMSLMQPVNQYLASDVAEPLPAEPRACCP